MPKVLNKEVYSKAAKNGAAVAAATFDGMAYYNADGTFGFNAKIIRKSATFINGLMACDFSAFTAATGMDSFIILSTVAQTPTDANKTARALLTAGLNDSTFNVQLVAAGADVTTGTTGLFDVTFLAYKDPA
jgi:hypothetical protein